MLIGSLSSIRATTWALRVEAIGRTSLLQADYIAHDTVLNDQVLGVMLSRASRKIEKANYRPMRGAIFISSS